MKNKILNAGMILSATLLMLSGCASDDTVSENNNTTPARLSINVVDGSFASADNAGAKTRSTDTDYGTTFTNGDAIGVFAVTTAGAFTVTNEKYTYNGSKWLSSAGDEYLPYSADTKYFAYYPYDATLASTKYTATGISASTFAATDFFAGLISGWTPSTDQSTHDKYTAQDLMVSMATVDGSTGYTFSMAHQMALMEMDFAQIQFWQSTGTSTGTSGYKYRFESHTPYDISGNGSKYRLLVKPSTAKTTVTGRIYSDLTTNSGAWYIQETSPAASNYKVYKYNSEEASLLSYVPAVGSLYNSDGTCTNKIVDGKTPVGVVVCTTSDYCESGSGYGHALVMALKNCTSATSTYTWRNEDKDAGLDKINTTKKMYNNSKSGYLNTDTIVNNRTRTTMVTYSQDVFPAFYQAVNYSLGTAPEGSTGWFLPSMGQWWDVLEKVAAYNGTSLGISSKHDDGSSYYYGDGDGTTAVSALNNLLSKNSLSSTLYDSFATGMYFWTSSEYISNGACGLDFFSNGYLYLSYNGKAHTYYVRPFLAF